MFRFPKRLGTGVTLLLATMAVGGARAEETPEPQVVRPALRAVVTPTRTLFPPNRPVWVRFTLQNASNEPLEIPLRRARASGAGITLPLELILGSPEEPALSLVYNDEEPVHPTMPDSRDAAASSPGLLRLAPRGAVGAEVDLRDFFRVLRYPGEYRLEWSPPGGRANKATARFQVEPRKEAIIVTDKGKMTFTLMYDQAPKNVEGFLELVKEGFYDGKTFHRVIPGFLIQGGCPRGDGTGIRPDGKFLPAEFHDAPFTVGTLAMARKPSDPDSASCQFFITLARLPELDGQYTVIGQATDDESLRTLNAIAAEPTDAHDRPRIPVVIRSINLAPIREATATRLELKPNRSPAGEPAEGTPPDQPPP